MLRITKSRRMSWAGHASRMGEEGTHTGLWWGSQKKRDHNKDLVVGERIILK
jgi:hypothetical protein